MRYDLSNLILTPRGTPHINEETKRAMTFQDAFFFCVSSILPGDDALPPEKKLLRYRLKQKIAGLESIVDLSDEERLLLKACASKVLSCDAYGQVHDFLEMPIL